MLLLDMHRLGAVSSQLLRTTSRAYELNETQLLIVLRLRGADRQGDRLALIDLAESLVCPLSTVASQCQKLVVRGLIAQDESETVRDYSRSGRKLYKLTNCGLEVSNQLRAILDSVDQLVRGAILRQSVSGVRLLSELLHEWSRLGALDSPEIFASALTARRIRTPQRGR